LQEARTIAEIAHEQAKDDMIRLFMRFATSSISSRAPSLTIEGCGPLLDHLGIALETLDQIPEVIRPGRTMARFADIYLTPPPARRA